MGEIYKLEKRNMRRSRKKAKSVNKKRAFVLSLGYWFGAHSLGLWLHPYQSMRRVVREGVFLPLVFLPSVCLGLWWFFGLVISRVALLSGLGLGLVADSLERFGPTQIVLSFGFVWVVVVLLLWQGVLVYLFWRFRD